MTDCIEWTGRLNNKGYPVFSVQGKPVYGHRWAYCQAHGIDMADIKGVVIRHTCDNPKCVNPAHLIPGTQRDNLNDMTERGRRAKGSTHGMARLTDAQVAEIRSRYQYRSRDNNVTTLAAEYGVAMQTIHNIVRGKSW